MVKKKVETRGRKCLSDEGTVRAGICLPQSLYDLLVKMGDESGQGYSHHIRVACEKMYRKKKSVKKKRKS